jgi:hypothetical protein
MTQDELQEKFVLLRFSLRDINILISCLNKPNQTDSITFASCIGAIDAQIRPQVEALNLEGQKSE